MINGRGLVREFTRSQNKPVKKIHKHTHTISEIEPKRIKYLKELSYSKRYV